MDLRFSPLFSGSSGNAVYVGCDDVHLLIDAGLSGVRICEALRGIGIAPSKLSAILVTHEHTDHIRGIGVLSRKYNLPVYATEGTWAAMSSKIGPVSKRNTRFLTPGQNFFLGPIDVTPFSTPHDAAESVGYSLELTGARFAVATDIGHLRESWLKYILGAHSILLESNYDPDMLETGPYPYDLKKRILSRNGHLSNDDAGQAAVRLAQHGAHQIILGHLSKENNFPDLALQCADMALRGAGIVPGEDIDLRVALRDSTTGLFSVRAGFV